MKHLLLLAALTLSTPAFAQTGAAPIAKEPTPVVQLDAAAARAEALKALKIVGQRMSWDRKANVVVYSMTFENTDPRRALVATFAARTVLTQIAGKLEGRECARALHTLKLEPGKRITIVGKLTYMDVKGYMVRLQLPDLARNADLFHRAALIERAP